MQTLLAGIRLFRHEIAVQRAYLCSVIGGEHKLSSILQQAFPTGSNVDVKDISGGCGAMYEIYVESEAFKGLSTVKQHRLITQALKTEIQSMHGLRINTSVPSDQ